MRVRREVQVRRGPGAPSADIAPGRRHRTPAGGVCRIPRAGRALFDTPQTPAPARRPTRNRPTPSAMPFDDQIAGLGGAKRSTPLPTRQPKGTRPPRRSTPPHPMPLAAARRAWRVDVRNEHLRATLRCRALSVAVIARYEHPRATLEVDASEGIASRRPPPRRRRPHDLAPSKPQLDDADTSSRLYHALSRPPRRGAARRAGRRARDRSSRRAARSSRAPAPRPPRPRPARSCR